MPLGSFRLNSLARYIAAIPPAPTEDTASKFLGYYGSAQISTTQSKFGGSSFAFPSDGAYLDVYPYSDFEWGTGAFTVEAWVWFPATENWQTLFANSNGNGSYAGDFFINWNGGLLGLVRGDNYQIRTNTGITTEAWNHIAFVANGSGLTTLYVNGTSVGSYTNTNAYQTTAMFIGGNTINGVGNNDFSSQNFEGYMDEIRISKVARYTSNFTAPTAAFTWDSDTTLLIHADSFNTSKLAWDDNGGRQAIELSSPPMASTSVTLSNTQKKFGDTSMYFSGSGSNFIGSIIRSNPSSIPIELVKWWNDPGFTLEYWFYCTDMNSLTPNDTTSGGGLVGQRYDNQDPGGQWWGFGPRRDGEVRFTAFAGPHRNFITTGAGITANTWNHIAFVFDYGTSISDSTVSIFVNGVAKFTQTVGSDGPYIAGDDNIHDIIGFCIGQNATVAGDNFAGYIDELRVSKVARYTGTFTPATAKFENDADTVLLLHGEGPNGSKVFRDDNSRLA